MSRSIFSLSVATSMMLAGLLVGGGAVPAMAEPATGALPAASASLPEDQITVMSDERQSTIVVDVDMRAVSLTSGRALPGQGDISPVPEKVTEDTTELFVVMQAEGESSLNHGAAFQIVMQDVPSGYWIEPTVRTYSYSDEWSYGCTVYHGDSENGGTIADDDVSPYFCSPELISVGNGGELAEVLFHVGLNRDAEVSGMVRTTGSVSLSQGTFSTDQRYKISGASKLAMNAATEFDSILLRGDIPHWGEEYRNQARTELSYRINVDGRPSNFWVGGFAMNRVNDWEFIAESRCNIYPNDPLQNGDVRLDDPINVPVTDSGFQCSAKGQFVFGKHIIGNSHYDATFTVRNVQDPL